MRKFTFLSILVLVFFSFQSFGQIGTMPLPKNEWCSGDSVNVNFGFEGPFTNFDIQLSDENGSFATPKILGSGPGSPIRVALNTNISGSKYRVRAVSTSPPSNGTPNNSDLTIYPHTKILTQPVADTTCEYGSANFSVSAEGANLSYQWEWSSDGVNYSFGPDSYWLANYTLNYAYWYYNGYTFRCRIIGQCDTLYTDPVMLTVNSGPVIQNNVKDADVCVGESAIFSFTPGNPGATFQWSYSSNGGQSFTEVTDDSQFSGAKTSSLKINATTVAMDQYVFHCLYGTSCGTTYSGLGTLNVGEPGITITSHPASDTVCTGYIYHTLSVAATGKGLKYRWQEKEKGALDFHDINYYWDLYFGYYADQNKADFTLNYVYKAGAKYRCIVSNACDADTSDEATITIPGNLNLLTDAKDAFVCGSSGDASFKIKGNEWITGYQWYVSTDSVNYNPIVESAMYSGSTTDSLHITGGTSSMDGYRYYCAISGKCGMSGASGQVALHYVTTQNIITKQPADIIVCWSYGATNVIANRSGLTYQWQERKGKTGNFVNISDNEVFVGTQSSDLGVNYPPNSMDGYFYRCLISDPCSAPIVSDTVMLKNPEVKILNQPKDTTVCEESPAGFGVKTSVPLKYQWEMSTDGGYNFEPLINDQVFSGADSSYLTVKETYTEMNGTWFRCKIGNCDDYTNAVRLNVDPSILSIQSQPSAFATVCLAGEETSLGVSSNSFKYQWQLKKAGGVFTNIDNAIYPDFEFNIYGDMDSSLVRCELTSVCSAPVYSDSTLLRVGTYFKSDPIDVELCEGGVDDTSFSVSAIGQYLYYQWQVSSDGEGYQHIQDGKNYSGSNLPTLQVIDATSEMNGYRYRCLLEAAGCEGDIRSEYAVLKVSSSAPYISEQPGNDVGCEGSYGGFGVSVNGNGANYQWQASYKGGPFVNLVNDTLYNNVKTDYLNILELSKDIENNKYRCVISGLCFSSIITDTVGYTVNPLPKFIKQPAVDTVIVCRGEVASFTAVAAGGNINYSWERFWPGENYWDNIYNGEEGYNGQHDSTLTVNTEEMYDTIRFRCFISNECTNFGYGGIEVEGGNGGPQGQFSFPNTSNEVVLIIRETPVLSLSVDSTSIAKGSYTAIKASGANTYEWSPAIGLNQTTGDSVVATLNITQKYGVKGTYATTGCFSVDSVQVFVRNIDVKITQLQKLKCHGDSTAEIFADVKGGDAPYSYLWVYGGETTDKLKNLPAGTFKVKVTDANGWVGVDSFVVAQPLKIVADAGSDKVICQGDSVQLGGAPAGTGGVGALSYSWIDQVYNNVSNASNPYIIPAASGNYHLTISDSAGCYAFDYLQVIVKATPEVDAGNDTTVCAQFPFGFNAKGATDYEWAPSKGLSSPNIPNPIVTANATTTYFVKGTANGCSHTDSIIVTVNALPAVIASADSVTCGVKTIKLFASGALNYMWSSASGVIGNAFAQNPDVTTSVNSIYIVQGTDINGCTNKDTVSVSVKTAPVVKMTGDTLICEGSFAQLNVTGATSYLWSEGSTSNSILSGPLATTTKYVVKGTTNGCSVKDSITVKVRPAPFISVSENAVICAGDSAFISVNGAPSYLWSNSSTDSYMYVSPVTTTTYTVSGTSAEGCTSPLKSVTITVNDLPVIKVSPDVSICTGESIRIGATGAMFFQWDGVFVADSITANPLVTKAFPVQGFSSNGCVALDTVLVTVNPLPNLSTSNDTSICEGESAMLKASGATTYSWTPSAGLSKTTGSSVIATPNTTTTYFVAGDSNGCKTINMVIVTVKQKPVVTASNDTAVCAGSSVILSAKGANSYLWHPSEDFLSNTGSSVTGFPFATTDYIVEGTSMNGCIAYDTVNVKINLYPTVKTNNDTTVCKGSSLTLTATGADTYKWSGVDSAYATSASPVITPTSQKMYIVTGTVAGCSSSDYVMVNVSDIPNVSAGSDFSLCSGSSSKLNATGADSYVWSPSADLNDATLANPTVTPVNSTDSITINKYYVVGTVNGCSSKDSMIINVFPLPSALISNSGQNSFCSGDSISLSTSGGGSYLWSNGAISQSIIVKASGKYSVKVIDTNACSATSAQTTIVVKAKPLANINSDGPTTFCKGDKVSLLATAVGGGTYSWSNGVSTQGVTIFESGNYAVKVTSGGCSTVSDSVKITVNPQAVAAFNHQVVGLKTKFINLSTDANFYTWTFGDGSNSNQKNISHVYAKDSTYKVKLIVSNVYGCPDTLEKTIGIKTYEISGNVYGEVKKNSMTSGKVYLLIYSNSIEHIQFADSTSINSDGTYKFNHVSENQYYLFAVPSVFEKGTFPSYFDGTANWLTANILTVKEITKGVNIPLKQNINLGGTGRIKGVVQEGLGFTKKEGAGSPLKGILVSLIDNGPDSTVTYDITDENGEFEFNNLPPGNYSVIPDIPGIPVRLNDGLNVFVITAQDTVITDIKIVADSNIIYVPGVVGIKSTKKENVFIVKTYPNPVKDILNIELSLIENQESEIRIFNILGKEVYHSDILNLTSGKNMLKLNTESFAEGAYFMTIIGGRSKTIISKFIIVR